EGDDGWRRLLTLRGVGARLFLQSRSDAAGSGSQDGGEQSFAALSRRRSGVADRRARDDEHGDGFSALGRRAEGRAVAIPTVKLSLDDRIGAGAFADVFAPAPGDRAFKVFRRLDDAYRREAPGLFANECAAYRIAMREETVRPYVPAFYGPVMVTSVADAAGLHGTAGFLLHPSYSLERL